MLDVDRAVDAGPDGAAPADALWRDAVRTGPWPDIFERLTTTYPFESADAAEPSAGA